MTPVNPAGLKKQARRFRPGGIKKTNPLVIPAIPVKSGTDVAKLVKISVIR